MSMRFYSGSSISRLFNTVCQIFLQGGLEQFASSNFPFVLRMRVKEANPHILHWLHIPNNWAMHKARTFKLAK